MKKNNNKFFFDTKEYFQNLCSIITIKDSSAKQKINFNPKIVVLLYNQH